MRTGRIVREIRVGRHKAGLVTVHWNGRDTRGLLVKPARYDFALTAVGSAGYRRTGEQHRRRAFG